MIRKKRLIDIDVAIGLSIILVVYGHLLLDDTLPLWYVKSREIVYQFHMPLFMFFSGFLMSYTYEKITSLETYRAYILKKVNKFIPAYMLFSLIFLAFEFLQGDRSMEQLKLDIIDILIYPSKAPAGFLWYIYVLLQFYIIFPLLENAVAKYSALTLLIVTALQFIDFNNLFNLDLFSAYLLFVVLGIIATHNISAYYKWLATLGLVFLIGFMAMIIAYNYYKIPKVVFGLFSIPAIHYIALQLSKFKIKDMLVELGKHSYYIYLMNTLFIGFFYLIVVKKLNFEFSSPIIIILFLIGVILPVFIHKKIIKPNRFLNKIIK